MTPTIEFDALPWVPSHTSSPERRWVVCARIEGEEWAVTFDPATADSKPIVMKRVPKGEVVDTQKDADGIINCTQCGKREFLGYAYCRHCGMRMPEVA